MGVDFLKKLKSSFELELTDVGWLKSKIVDFDHDNLFGNTKLAIHLGLHVDLTKNVKFNRWA